MACEKCWGKAYLLMRIGLYESQADAYQDLLLHNPINGCTPEEICGVDTTEMHTIHPGHDKCYCGLKRTPPSPQQEAPS